MLILSDFNQHGCVWISSMMSTDNFCIIEEPPKAHFCPSWGDGQGSGLHLKNNWFLSNLGIVYNYQCFKKKNNVLLCGWVGQSEKSMFLVFFSLNPDIPWYVSCLENIHFMLKNIHFICSHDIKFKYKNVLLNIPMMHCSTM